MPISLRAWDTSSPANRSLAGRSPPPMMGERHSPGRERHHGPHSRQRHRVRDRPGLRCSRTRTQHARPGPATGWSGNQRPGCRWTIPPRSVSPPRSRSSGYRIAVDERRHGNVSAVRRPHQPSVRLLFRRSHLVRYRTFYPLHSKRDFPGRSAAPIRGARAATDHGERTLLHQGHARRRCRRDHFPRSGNSRDLLPALS